ncbi:hypothetical protein O6P43_005770 [Quillaja saponaria]|uniref:Uncharacterized protein n=1 Tax=Quillaja saponaria TaxID=32244 RepID=A0AAD7Q6V9_QUISA|nr:hypothetical protein O6P43_005770 [Quillaja saponaria]
MKLSPTNLADCEWREVYCSFGWLNLQQSEIACKGRFPLFMVHRLYLAHSPVFVSFCSSSLLVQELYFLVYHHFPSFITVEIGCGILGLPMRL